AGSDPEAILDAPHLSARRLRDPPALSDGDSGGDLLVRRRLRDRTRGRVHGHPADGSRALRRASARSCHGDRARGRWRGRSRRTLARRADARRGRELRVRFRGADRLCAGGRGGDFVPAEDLTPCVHLRRGAACCAPTGGLMAPQRIGVIMNGVTGRMGLNQHLVRSILAIRELGGVALPNGDRLVPDPILVGRNEAKRRAIAAGKHVYCEKPLAATTTEALELAKAAGAGGVKHGVVQDKLFLPGIRKLKRLVDDGLFGRILSVRGEFGYWVFEGDSEPAQRPSWNYRKEERGGIILDMFAHWRYLLDHTFGGVTAVQCTGATHIPERVDERGQRYA